MRLAGGAVGAGQGPPVTGFLYFGSLAALAIFLGGRRGRRASTRTVITVRDGLLAPVTLSVSLSAIYVATKLGLDFGAVLNAYFFLVEALAAGAGLAVAFGFAGAALGESGFGVPVPGWLEEGGEPVGELEVLPSAALAGAAGAALAAWDVASGHSSWVLNNFMACMLAAFFLENLSLSSFRAAAILLGGLLVYDAFWVFGSSAALEALLGAGSAFAPEKGSVMLDVASSPLIEAPTKLLFPAPLSAARPDGGFSLLGLGDIVVPGLLVAFAMRFDEAEESERKGETKRDLYAAWALGAYILGLGLTFLANSATASAQPALVYLSPATVGAVALVSAARGELPRLLAFEVPADGDGGDGGD